MQFQKQIILFLTVLALASCGSSAGNNGEGASGGESLPETEIESTEYDPDASDTVSPSGLPTVTEGADSTVTMTCAEATTTADGLAQLACLGLTYYFACDEGDIVIGGSPDGTGTKYTDCSSVERNCGSGGGMALTSTDCARTQVSMSDYFSGESGGDTSGEEDQDTDDNENNGDGENDETETQTVIGEITSSDSAGSCDALFTTIYYDIHELDAYAGQMVEIFLEATYSDGTEAMLGLALYDPDNFNSSELIACGDWLEFNSQAGDWEDGIVADISTEIPADGTYWITVEGFFTEETSGQNISYTLTWTIE